MRLRDARQQTVNRAHRRSRPPGEHRGACAAACPAPTDRSSGCVRASGRNSARGPANPRRIVQRIRRVQRVPHRWGRPTRHTDPHHRQRRDPQLVSLRQRTRRLCFTSARVWCWCSILAKALAGFETLLQRTSSESTSEHAHRASHVSTARLSRSFARSSSEQGWIRSVSRGYDPDPAGSG